MSLFDSHPQSSSRSCRPAGFLFLAACLIAPTFASAQVSLENAAREQRRQEERVNAIRQQQEQGIDIRRAAPPAADQTRLPEAEQPCFAINRLVLVGDDTGDFGWLLNAASGPQGDDSPQGRCLGQQGINLILGRMQNALVASGYITTRVSVAPQDLRSGELQVTVTPGRIREIRHAEDSQRAVWLPAVIPASPGDLLNLRDIEQGLENLRGLPTADADIKIMPGKLPGESDLVIAHRQTFPLRGTLTVDDSGTKATGKYQGGVTVAFDNPAHLSDLLYLTLNHDITGKGGRGTDGGVLHYSVPIGYWNAALTLDGGNNHQTIAGAFQNYTYSGRTANAEFKLGRVVYRDGNNKTSLSASAFRRAASNFIDDTEVEVQRRRTGGWQASINQRHFQAGTVLDVTLGYKRGTGAFHAIVAPEEAFEEGTARFQIITLDMTYAMPFKLAETPWRYQINLRGQKNETRLAAPERFSIGGRQTVRGFDGETILSAENGWLMRNELSTGVPLGAELYLGVDYGEVGGPTSDLLIGKSLAGTAVGVRGSYRKLRYDVFAGTPLRKPGGFVTANLTGGFSLAVNF